MTTLKVGNVEHPTSGSLATINGTAPSNRNRIINGDMRIDQRNAGASVTTNGAYTVDRFAQSQTGGGVVSWARSTVCPTGFTHSLGATVTTADSSIAAADYYRLYHHIEGFNAADFNFGSAAAQTITLSFWVRSSVTGTYCIGLQNGVYNRSYAAQYTISTANTWEHKTITIAGDTSGTWATDNTAGVTVFWDLGTGSTYNQTANTWVATNTWKTSSQTSWIATNGATFYITGVQLEVGSVATPFEHRSYGDELARCQRYYQKTYALDVVPGTNTTDGCVVTHAFNGAFSRVNWHFNTLMRASPSVTIYSTSGAVNSFRNIDDLVDDTGVVAYISTGRVTLQSNNNANSTGKLLGAHAVASIEL